LRRDFEITISKTRLQIKIVRRNGIIASEITQNGILAERKD
jgi:hypothetical protein